MMMILNYHTQSFFGHYHTHIIFLGKPFKPWCDHPDCDQTLWLNQKVHWSCLDFPPLLPHVRSTEIVSDLHTLCLDFHWMVNHRFWHLKCDSCRILGHVIVKLVSETMQKLLGDQASFRVYGYGQMYSDICAYFR